MLLNIYTIYDSAAVAYMRPFFQQSDGQAMRSFSDIALDADHEIGKHPEDYSLFRIGTYNDNTGEIKPLNRECLATALEVVAKARNVNKDNLETLNKEVTDA